MTKRSRLQLAREAFYDAMRDLESAVNEYREERRKLEKSQDYTPEAKARKASELAKQYRAEVRTRQEAAADALAYWQAGIQKTAETPKAEGNEAVLARMEAIDARSRVRSMLDSGTKPRQILERAQQLGDLTTLDALRTEATWMDCGTDWGADGVVQHRQADGLLRRIDEARADVIGGDRGDAIRQMTTGPQMDAWAAKITRLGDIEGTGPLSPLGAAVADHYDGTALPRKRDAARPEPADQPAGPVGHDASESLGEAVHVAYLPNYSGEGDAA